MATSISESVEQLHDALSDYIEAAYHISNPDLVKQRKELLQRPGVISQKPFIESTPRYVSGNDFASITGIPKAVLELFNILANPTPGRGRLIYDPPYKHQLESIEKVLVHGKNVMIMTGTGSGKTESFLLPILGKLITEAAGKPQAFRTHAVRAIVLYPMNALVNDQLGRIRNLFGDEALKGIFSEYGERVPTFARYTSRTPYPGVRDPKKDRTKLLSMRDFYVALEETANGPVGEARNKAIKLISDLKAKGKWPAKPSLANWFGGRNERWQNTSNEFQRAVTLPEDSELITRHEVQANPPDLLITNYSMLEYMLLRPIERPIFEATSQWLRNNPNEKFLIVIDEAHLYRGASGAEVGLLLRRLRERLEIPPERFQVICASASFQDAEYAVNFASQLTGVPCDSFESIRGEFAYKNIDPIDFTREAHLLNTIDLEGFYNATAEDRLPYITTFLEARGIAFEHDIPFTLFKALENYPPLNKLINDTMGTAKPVDEIAQSIFNVPYDVAAGALHVLTALGSIARKAEGEPGLLPCRLHTFFRGLPGLWACIDPNCPAGGYSERARVTGKLYAQPRSYCECGARVFELFTCRSCGTAYIRAYTDNLAAPINLWQQQGIPIRLTSSAIRSLFPVDILLEENRSVEGAVIAELDIKAGKLNPQHLGEHTRQVFIKHIDHGDSNEDRRFEKCPVCSYKVEDGFPVQDHQTKGDEPFRALIARQIQIQPPNDSNSTYFAPLRGRKVLIFSDSRQTAAKLAPNLQMFSHRDAIRPLLMWGIRKIKSNVQIGKLFNLNDCYLALLIASNFFDVRLQPELAGAENFQTLNNIVRKVVKRGGLDNESEFANLFFNYRSERAPESLLKEIVNILTHNLTGVESLALASVCITAQAAEIINELPDISGVAETIPEKYALVNLWVRCWAKLGYWLTTMPDNWWQPTGRRPANKVTGHNTGAFNVVDQVLSSSSAKKAFRNNWLPILLATLTEEQNGIYRMLGRNLELDFSVDWVRCQNCSSVYRSPFLTNKCIKCSSQNTNSLEPENDEVFDARKGYYREGTIAILAQTPNPPVCLNAAEHTAQLNASQVEDIFSKGERNELLFQDINIQWPEGQDNEAAIDILSSTTTMEVGIDIGALSGVALRNMPPGRANYQQRAGRAGRRGNAIATVVAFGSVDSHDEHYFSNPKELISGELTDPIITLDNADIVKRHIRAFLLQNYHRARLPDSPDKRHTADLFSVLGSVQNFLTRSAPLNRWDFSEWLERNKVHLSNRIASWIPEQLQQKVRTDLINDAFADCTAEVDHAIEYKEGTQGVTYAPREVYDDEDDNIENNFSTSGASEKLLEQLLYKGKLPRYAFPTDVASFYVFDNERSTNFKTMMRFSPSQSLPIALTQYAPDKQVWIANKCYTSGAIYSPIHGELFATWQNKRLYFECHVCGFAKTMPYNVESKNDKLSCDACGETLQKPQTWLRPPGFAHPVNILEQTSPDGIPEVGYATRAKLYMSFGQESQWRSTNERIAGLKLREHLLVSNAGPDNEGYIYCVKCGCIASRVNSPGSLSGPHAKPFPSDNPTCEGGRTSTIVLGTDFITDVALFSLNLAPYVTLIPGSYTYHVALRTLSEALAKAACRMLEVEPNDIVAEYRPALTDSKSGRDGHSVEIFLYDTLPGGAGFSPQLVDRGLELFKTAYRIMSECSASCDTSCYRCLRMFGNRIEHHYLDRHLGIALCHFLLNNSVPQLSETRIQIAMQALREDLLRSVDNWDISFESDEYGVVNYNLLAISKHNRKFIVGISSPLTPGVINDVELRSGIAMGTIQPHSVFIADEFLLRTNLPSATILIIERFHLID